MSQKKAQDALGHLEPTERSRVLDELLKRHEELRGEANEIAESVIEDVAAWEVADEVNFLLKIIDAHDIDGRSGHQPMGYVDPIDAADELLQEALQEPLDDMKRRFEAGKKAAAERTCQGIVIGLHDLDEPADGSALQLSEDFPESAAGECLSLLLKMYPRNQRKAAGDRIIRGVMEGAEKDAANWMEMLERTVSSSAAEK